MSNEEGYGEWPRPAVELTTLVKGAGIFLLGTVLSVALRYAFEILLARSLGPSSFGVFFLGLAVFKVLEKVATLEASSGMLRFVSLYKGAGETGKMKGTILAGLKIALLAGTVVAVALFLLSSALARGIFHEPLLSPVLKILSFGLIFTAGTEIVVYSLQALGAIQNRVYVRMLFEPGFNILFALLFLRMGLGLSGAGLALTIPIGLAMVLALSLLRKQFPQFMQKEVRSQADVKRLLGFSLPLFGGGMLGLFTRQVTPLMLGYFRPAAEVGIFAAGLRTSLLLALVLDSFNAIFAPMIADLTHRGELRKLASLFKIVTKWVFALVLPLFLAWLFLGREILGLWGREYQQGLTCLVVLSLGQLVNCLTGPVGYMISMSGRTPISLANAAGVLLFNLVLNLLLIPRSGLLGAAVAVAGALSLVNLAKLIEVWFFLKMHPYRRDFLKPIVAASGASLFFWLLKSWVLPSEGVVLRLGLAAFLLFFPYALILIVQGISQEEKFILMRIKQRLLS